MISMMSYDLTRSPDGAPVTLGAEDTLTFLNHCVDQGVSLGTRTFRGHDGRFVTVFWMDGDPGDGIVYVWEYTHHVRRAPHTMGRLIQRMAA